MDSHTRCLRHTPSLAAIDLNLLVVFDALMAEHSVSRAADRIGLSQPAVSNALRRLRNLLEDELLVRNGMRMEPTARATELYPAVAEALQGVSRALWGPECFDPQQSDRIFRLAMTDSGAHLVLPALLRRLQAIAPRVSISVSHCGVEDGGRRILAGEMELGVGVFPEPQRGLRARALTHEAEILCLASRAHSRLADGRLDYEAYFQSPHVVVGINGDRMTLDMAAEALGMMRKVVAVVPYFSAVPPIVRGTDIVGPCNPNYVRTLAYRDELAVFPAPFPTRKYSLKLVWRSSTTNDAALRWMMEQIAYVVSREVPWGERPTPAEGSACEMDFVQHDLRRPRGTVPLPP